MALQNNSTGQTINLYGYPSAIVALPSKGSFTGSGNQIDMYPVVGESQFTLSVYSTMTATDEEIIPENFALNQPYPNPFNPSTVIGYDVAENSNVMLQVFDIMGKHVTTLLDGYVPAGKHEVTWHSNDISSGIYLIRLVAGEKIFNQKVTYLK